jgi:metallo-beta-lactamase family protein
MSIPVECKCYQYFQGHPECFNEKILKVIETDPDPFGFNSLHYITSSEESRQLNDTKKPCVIISASGMMEAGRVKHHLANSLANPKNTVLAVGYCAPSTLGAKILRGDKQVSIFGKPVDVNADVRRIEAFSGHADYKEMIQFLKCQEPSQVKKTFIVHGEYKAQQTYKGYLEEEGFKNIEIPALGEEFEL